MGTINGVELLRNRIVELINYSKHCGPDCKVYDLYFGVRYSVSMSDKPDEVFAKFWQEYFRGTK
jgi:hypothetical protein